MTREEILETIAKQPKYLGMCRHITGTENIQLANDLYQEAFVCLCEMEADKLIEIYFSENQRFDRYYFGLVARQFRSKSCTFYKAYIQPKRFFKECSEDVLYNNEIDFLSSDDDNEELVGLFRRAMMEIEKNNYTGVKLLEIRSQTRTTKQVAIDTRIPIRSVYNIIQQTKREVKLKIERYKRMKK